MRGRSRPRGEPGPPHAHAHTHPSLPPRMGREEAGRCHHPAAQRKEGAGPLGSAGRSATARPIRPRGATRGSPGPALSPYPSFAHAFASPLFLCLCLCVDFLTLLPHPANSGYLWLHRHSPFSPPPRVCPTGGITSVVPLRKLFSIPSPSPS